MSRKGIIYQNNNLAGLIEETEDGYSFSYAKEYLGNEKALAISLTLPLQEESYLSTTLFSYFDGLIPEGWLLDIAQENWKLNYKDRFGLLLACCKNTIGAVSIIEETE
jgi:serine/threonine-protein kinase HipA